MPCPRCKGSGFFRAEVPITAPNFGKAIPCECKQQEVALALKRESRIGKTQEQWTIDNFPGDKFAREYARHVYDAKHGIWIFWSAQFGTGKTGLLIAIVNAFQADGVAALYKSVPRMLDELRASYQDGDYAALMDSLITIPVLALDEFHRWYNKAGREDAAEGSQSWATEKMFTIIDERYLHGDELMTLVATNRQPDKGDDPISSRFSDQRVSHIFQVGGSDIRRGSSAKTIEVEDWSG